MVASVVQRFLKLIGQFSGLDQAVVSIAALIQHANAIRISVAKHYKLIGVRRQPESRFFGSHRLD
jgi:hypothetical protein